MINRILGAGGTDIEITSGDGREFRLAVADLPSPANPGDRYDVEQQVLAMIKAVFSEDVRYHIYSLDPVRHLVILACEDTPETWWVI